MVVTVVAAQREAVCWEKMAEGMRAGRMFILIVALLRVVPRYVCV